MTESARTVIPGQSRPWPSDVAIALDAWRQGHILDGVPLMSIGQKNAGDPLWAAASPVVEIEGVPILAELIPQLYRAMVVSQGCDLVKPTFPLATCVPVYDATQILSDQQQSAAKAGRTWHLVHLTAPWSTDGCWVADLRMEIPIDKGVLAAQTPTEAFVDEVGYAKLAERLAAVRQRPAVPEPCLDHVVKPLNEGLARIFKTGVDPLDGVREIRIQSDHPVTPKSATLFVITSDTDQRPDLHVWAELMEPIYERAASADIALVGPEIQSLWDMTAADYLTSQAILADSS